APVTDDDGYTETERLAFIDQSSGLLNTRTMLGKLAKEAKRASRYKNPFSVLIIELDGYNNSEESSLTRLGAEVIFSSFAKIIKQNIRDVDIVGRFDEPSLMLICPETNLSEAVEEAGRLRHVVAGAHFKNVGHHVNMTVSIGIASFPDNGSAPVMILGAALEAAQQAVSLGGNTVCTAAIDASVTTTEPTKPVEPKMPIEQPEDFSPAFDAAVDTPAEDMSPSKPASTEIVFPTADITPIIT
ncbi:MAG: GGDEF domain-containing protein, partial [Candidatus Obscuribacterales bacterium]|nr:GGDEF domain-containing protein [Candidatus Obscuribacterales bacterium]